MEHISFPTWLRACASTQVLNAKCNALFVPLQLQLQLHSTWLCHLSCYGVNDALIIREWKDEKDASKAAQVAIKDRKWKLVPCSNYRDIRSIITCFK